MPASQRYKVRLCRIETQEIAVFCGADLYSSLHDILLDSRLLHNRWTDFDARCGGLLGSMSASQRCDVRLCRIETQDIAGFCGGCISYPAGDILLDGRILHNRETDFDALCRRMLDLTPALYQYKVRLCRIKTQEVAVFGEGDLYSTSPSDIFLQSRLLNDPWTDLDALCGRLLGSMSAFQWYKVRQCRI